MSPLHVTRLFVVAALVAAPAWAQDAGTEAPVAQAAAPAPAPEVAQPAEAPRALPGCDQAKAHGLPEGPVALGYFEADMATGRRACPRTEAGLGARFGAIIDTPNFYGSLGVNGVLFGSWAFRPDTEVFATLEAVNFNFTQNAVLTATQLTLGNLTVGASNAVVKRETFIGSLSARLLLPTSFETPGARTVGAEIGFAASWRPLGWLEVHGYAGGDVTSAFSRAAPYTRFGAILLAGAQWTPVSWFAFVLDLSVRAGALTYFAPTAGLRFRIARLGIEIGATLPLAGSDRHDFIMGARFSWRID